MTFLDPFFWIHLIYFCFAIFLACFIPGNFFIRNITKNIFHNIVLSTVFGMVLWALQGFILGLIHLELLSYLYLLMFFLLWLRKIQIKMFRDIRIQWRLMDIFLVVLILGGVLIQFVSVGFNGIVNNDTLYFCCNIPDSLYHLALVHALVSHVPPLEPGMSNEVVKNYHYLGNLMVAELIRIFHLPLLYTQNQYLPIFLGVFMGLSAIVFAQVNKMKILYIRWMLFFLYYYGDFIYFISFLLGKGINFTYSMQENGASIWVSPPRVFGIVIFFTGLAFLKIWLQKRSFYSGMLFAVTMGCLIGFKVYTGIFALSGIAFLGMYFLYKKDINRLGILCACVLSSLAIYLPVNSASGGLFFVGLWRLEDFIVNPAYGLSNLELARRIYLDHHSIFRVVQYELMYAALYIPSLFGIHLLSFFQNKKSFSELSKEYHIYLISGAFVSAILGMFFFQQVGGANTSQFFFSLYIVGAIYSALFCSTFIPMLKKPLQGIAIFIIVILTVSRTIYTTYTNYLYITKIIPVIVTFDEQEAIRYINTKTPESSTILIGDKKLTVSNNSYYLSVLVNRQFFLLGNGILNDHGVNTQKRMRALQTILYNKNAAIVKKTLLENNISYIYLPKGVRLVSTQSAEFLPTVFYNKEIKIVQVNKNNIKNLPYIQ